LFDSFTLYSPFIHSQCGSSALPHYQFLKISTCGHGLYGGLPISSDSASAYTPTFRPRTLRRTTQFTDQSQAYSRTWYLYISDKVTLHRKFHRHIIFILSLGLHGENV